MIGRSDRPLQVLVTRPEPSASLTAAHLIDLGFEAKVAPLTSIEPLRPPMLIDGRVRVIATSANAFLADAPQGFAFHHVQDFICVGEKTARAGVDWGLPDPAIVAPDAATLIERAAEAGFELTRWPITYLAGRERSPQIERALGEMGAQYRVFETYCAPAVLDPFLNIEAGQADVALIMSPRAAQLFGERWSQEQVPMLACISPAARDALPDGFLNRSVVSAEPNFQSLLACLFDFKEPPNS